MANNLFKLTDELRKSPLWKAMNVAMMITQHGQNQMKQMILNGCTKEYSSEQELIHNVMMWFDTVGEEYVLNVLDEHGYVIDNYIITACRLMK